MRGCSRLGRGVAATGKYQCPSATGVLRGGVELLANFQGGQVVEMPSSTLNSPSIPAEVRRSMLSHDFNEDRLSVTTRGRDRLGINFAGREATTAPSKRKTVERNERIMVARSTQPPWQHLHHRPRNGSSTSTLHPSQNRRRLPPSPTLQASPQLSCSQETNPPAIKTTSKPQRPENPLRQKRWTNSS